MSKIDNIEKIVLEMDAFITEMAKKRPLTDEEFDIWNYVVRMFKELGYVECDNCEGMGEIWRGEDYITCPKCNGIVMYKK